MPLLQITQPDKEDKLTFNLSDAKIRIGRSIASELQLDDSSVSRDHAFVYPSGDNYLIEDVGSMNGVWLNGQRIDKPEILQNRDHIMIGDFELVFLR